MITTNIQTGQETSWVVVEEVLEEELAVEHHNKVPTWDMTSGSKCAVSGSIRIWIE